jgi:hypothetical protein
MFTSLSTSTQNTKRAPVSLHFDLPSQRRRSPLAAPLRPHPASLPAGAAPSPHPRLIPSPPPPPPLPHPTALNREFLLTLETGLPAGVLDDAPQSRAVRLASCWVLPASYRPWDPLLVHGIDDRSWPSSVTGRLQVRHHGRAGAHHRRLRGIP